MIDFREFKELTRCHPLLFHPAMRLQDKLQRATLGTKRWATVVERIERKERIMRFRRKNKGQMPPLSLRQSCWKCMHARDPNEALLDVELREEAREKGLPPPKLPPCWLVGVRHALAFTVALVLLALVLALVMLVMKLGWNVGPFSVYVHDPSCRMPCHDPSPCKDTIWCCQDHLELGVCHNALPVVSGLDGWSAGGDGGTRAFFSCPKSVADALPARKQADDPPQCFCPNVNQRQLADSSTASDPTDICERVEEEEEVEKR